MPHIEHPDAPLELARLREVQAVIAQESVAAEDGRVRAFDNLENARSYDPDALPVREMVYALAAQRVRNLALAAKKTYFTRIDFTPTGGTPQTHYIGRYGVLRTDTLQSVVVDWRSPISNLYYSGQVGPMHYVTPDGEVHGELSLKRQFAIEEGELLTIFDTDVVSQDAYLQSVLGAMSGDRLREIVTTIQAEQNYVIRHPPSRALVVQGVAGSGKTTIALHRIAYLLYAYQQDMLAHHMLVLAPNPLFLNYISGVLPDLGVDRVRQTTFPLLIAQWLGDALPGKMPSAAHSGLMDIGDAERDRLARIAHLKGSLAHGRRLEAYLDDVEARIVPTEPLKFGPVTLLTVEQLRSFLLIDVKPFSLTRRLAEYKKRVKRLAKDGAQRVEAWLMEECQKRVDQLKAQMEDGEPRQLRIRKLYASRDERLKQTKEAVTPFVKATMSAFAKLDLGTIYKAFWQLPAPDEDYALAREHTLRNLEAKKLDSEDLCALAMIAMRVLELPAQDIRHVVVDEAQDFSPLEFELLARIAGNTHFTLVGDLMQGVNAHRGLRDWNEVIEGVLHGESSWHHLVTSYRNTIEIMNTALRVARNRPVPGQREAQPVLRHGPEPEIIALADENAQLQCISSQLREWQAQGLSSIAVIHRDVEHVRRLHGQLSKELPVSLLDVEAHEYAGGLLIAPASSVKGLEFDGVIVADAGERWFPDREMEARMLYVCLTRPLHRLTICHTGALTPLLIDSPAHAG